MELLERLLSAQTIERIGWTLIHFVWQGTAVALLLAIILRVLGKCSAAMRYVVACTALVLVVALPLITMQFVEVSGPTAEAGPVMTSLTTVETLPVQMVEVSELPFEPIEATPIEFTPVEIRVPWTQRAVTTLEPILPYLVFGWLLGVFGLSAWHLGGWAQLQRMRRRMVREVPAALNAKLSELASQLGVGRAVGMLQSALVDVPTVVGWIKPMILLPASALSGLTSDQLEAVLAHELAHIRRYDYLVNILQTVVEILGFYHPGLWWISQKIRDERENCCDDLAVKVTGDSVRYARALTSLEEMRHRSVELAMAAGGGNLVGRIARLLGRPAPKRGRFTWLPGLIALVLATLIVIPTALVLAAPKPMPLETAMAELPVQEEIEANKPAVETTPEPVETPAIPAAAEAPEIARNEDKPVVDLTLILAKVRTEAVLDREMIDTIADVLAQDRPEVRDEIRALGSGSNVTLGRLVQKCVMGKLLTPGTAEKFMSTLDSAGLLEIVAKPSMRTLDNQSANITIGQEVPIPLEADPNAGVTYANVGTSIEVIPHLSEKRDLAIVQMDVTLNELTEDPKPNGRPGINTKQIATEVAVSNDRYFSLLMDTNEANKTTDEEPLLLIFRTRWDETSTKQEAAPVQTAPPTPDPERFVKLDVRIVEMDRDDVWNIGIEWGWPNIRTGPFSERVLWESTPGYAGRGSQSEEILAKLNELCEQGRANVLSTPRVTARHGHASEITAMEEEYYLLRPDGTEEMVTITGGIKIETTPFIDDNNDVTLRVDTEINDVKLSEDRNNMPIVTRRTSLNVATMHDGGIMVLFGLSPMSDSQDDESHKAIFILISPRILSDAEAAMLPHKKKPAPLPTIGEKTPEPSSDVPLRERLDTAKTIESPMLPNANDARTSNQGSNGVKIETRFVMLGDDLVEAIQEGLPIEGVTDVEDVNALHALGKQMVADKWLVVDEAQKSLLMKTAQSHPESKSLAAPCVNVRADEDASFRLEEETPYIAGYQERTDSTGKPVPKRATVLRGMVMDITPSLASNDRITLNGSIKFTDLLGFTEKKYQNEHVYQIPQLDIRKIDMDDVQVGSAQTALLLAPLDVSKIQPDTTISDKAQPLCILITATKIEIDNQVASNELSTPEDF